MPHLFTIISYFLLKIWCRSVCVDNKKGTETLEKFPSPFAFVVFKESDSIINVGGVGGIKSNYKAFSCT